MYVLFFCNNDLLKPTTKIQGGGGGTGNFGILECPKENYVMFMAITLTSKVVNITKHFLEANLALSFDSGVHLRCVTFQQSHSVTNQK